MFTKEMMHAYAVRSFLGRSFVRFLGKKPNERTRGPRSASVRLSFGIRTRARPTRTKPEGVMRLSVRCAFDERSCYGLQHDPIVRRSFGDYLL